MQLFEAIVAAALSAPSASQSRAPVAVGAVTRSSSGFALDFRTSLEFDNGIVFSTICSSAIYFRDTIFIHIPHILLRFRTFFAQFLSNDTTESTRV